MITPILDAEGKPVSLLAVLRDVTQSRQAKHMLIRQTAELNNLYATAPVGLNTFDTQLRYLRINQMMAEMNGLPAEQHMARACAMCWRGNWPMWSNLSSVKCSQPAGRC
ncbi:hypothetical protein ACVBEH_01540 [Roseateles sp. GG27B]